MIDNDSAKYSLTYQAYDAYDNSVTATTKHVKQSIMANGTVENARLIDTTMRALGYLTTNSYKDTMITGKGSVNEALEE